jgi:hypothetical protein
MSGLNFWSKSKSSLIGQSQSLIGQNQIQRLTSCQIDFVVKVEILELLACSNH